MIFQKSYTPPSGFMDEYLCCFPTDTGYYESDYKAVMENRQSLRIWSHSEWPEDSFTKEQNKVDLQHHVDDNAAHSAYGYMLYNPDKTVCLGSVYVNPIDSLKTYYTVTGGPASLLESLQSRIDFWIRDSPVERQLQISKRILKWIQRDWEINACFTARERMTDRIRIYEELGLRKVLSLKYREDNSALYVYQ